MVSEAEFCGGGAGGGEMFWAQARDFGRLWLGEDDRDKIILRLRVILVMLSRNHLLLLPFKPSRLSSGQEA